MKIKGKIFIIFLLIIAIFIMANLVRYKILKNIIIEKELEKQGEALLRVEHEITSTINEVKNDAFALAILPPLYDFLAAPEDEAKEEVAENIIIQLAKNKTQYVDISIIDKNGNELVRSDEEETENAETEITNRQYEKQAYFQEIAKIKNACYISEITLSTKDGKPEVPLKSFIRIVAPIRGSNIDTVKGFIKIDLETSRLFSQILAMDKNIYWLDENGYYAINPQNKNYEWGKQLNTGYNYKNEEVGADLFKIKEGNKNVYIYFSEMNGGGRIYSYKRINYNPLDQEKYWIIVKIVEKGEIFSSFRSMFSVNIYLILLILAVIAVSLYYLAVKITRIISSISEATEKLNEGKYAKIKLPSENDETRTLVENFNKTMEGLRKQKRKIYNFITSASHQLRTPISVIRLQNELIKDAAGKNKSRAGKVMAASEEIETQAEKVSDILRDLLKIVEIGYGYDLVNVEEVKITELLKEILSSYESRAKNKGLKIAVKAREDLVVKANPRDLKKVITDLVDNAIAYSNDKGGIEISLEEKEVEILFTISDSGIGIPADDQTNVFDDLFRAKNSYSKKNVGTGLGLYIAKIIIEGHGGKIWFKSAENQGTTFYFTIPKK